MKWVGKGKEKGRDERMPRQMLNLCIFGCKNAISFEISRIKWNLVAHVQRAAGHLASVVVSVLAFLFF